MYASEEKYNLNKPKFADERGSFIVTFYKSGNINKTEPEVEVTNDLLVFCRTPCNAFACTSLLFSISSVVYIFAKENKKEEIIRFVIDTLAIAEAVNNKFDVK